MSLKKLQENSIKEMMFEVFGNKAIKNLLDQQQKERPKGTFHCSNIIVEPSNFCARKQLLDYKNGNSFKISPQLGKIFLAGTSIHEKWQKLFEREKVDKKIEVTHYSKKLHLTGTPDAIVELWGKSWVIEIKSVRSEIFNKMTLTNYPVSSAIIQANLYMFLASIPRAIILTENKNTQEVKTFFIKFEPEKIYNYLNQHLKVLEYLKNKKLPKCVCKSSNDKLFKSCNYKCIRKV